MTTKKDFKFVKKANMYVRTWFEESSGYGSTGKPTQKQEWISRDEYEKLPS